ncbi:membrane protein [Streptococcus pneumoniae]|nr:membrane protein [Streptococcus pneumoniae]CNV60404.1 membrane protein [Streptococcus pneumoniae]
MIHLIMISAIALAIGIGYRTKINIGLLAIAFSYLIATTLMGLSPKELLHFWPTSLFFTIFSVSLFYNVATTNGTLDVPNALYMILYLMATLLSALGAGFFTTMAVCCPLAITLCQKADKHPLIGAQAVNWGASGGANLITKGIKYYVFYRFHQLNILTSFEKIFTITTKFLLCNKAVGFGDTDPD